MRRSVRVTGWCWPGGMPRPGSVTSRASAVSCSVEPARLERVATVVDDGLERGLRVVDRFAGRRNLGRRQLAELAELGREQSLLAEVLHTYGIERGQVFGRAHGRFGLAQ